MSEKNNEFKIKIEIFKLYKFSFQKFSDFWIFFSEFFKI